MRRAAFHIIAILGAGLAAGCSASTVGPTAVSHGQRSVLPDTSVPAAYTILGRQIKACWFNPADPVLPEHIFRAEVPATGAPDPTTRIIVYTKAPDGRLGLKAYTVSLERQGSGTAITTENHKLDYPLAQKLSADVGYWIQGGSTCNNGPSQSSGSAPAGSVATQR